MDEAEAGGTAWPGTTGAEGVVPSFYLRNGREWARARDAVVVSRGGLEARSYPEGMVLPVRRRREGDVFPPNGVLLGGACDAGGTFVGGHVCDPGAWNGLNCTYTYTVDPSQVRWSDECVIFGGVIYNHFGHTLVDSTSRFWYLDPETVAGRRIAFVVAPVERFRSHTPGAFWTLLAAQGFSRDDVLIVQEPTRFSEVVVPDESFSLRSGGDPAGMVAFRRMRDSVSAGDAKKVFLSRGEFWRQDCVNEAFLERFYTERGFTVVHPEKLGFEEQVSIMAGAEQIATTLGTMSHLAVLFSQDDAQVTIFPRSTTVVKQQLVLDVLCEKSPVYVDAIRSVLPTHNNSFAFLFGPTRYMRAYLDDAGMAYDAEELSSKNLSDSDIVTFLRQYDHAATVNEDLAQNELRDFDIVDVCVALHEGLNDEPASRSDYPHASAPKKRSVALRRCSWGEGRLGLVLAEPSITEDVEVEVAAVAGTGGERPISQSVRIVKEGVAEVSLDIEGFFQELCGDGMPATRWNLCVKMRGASIPISVAPASREFIRFFSFFLYREGRLLAPHTDAAGRLCLWYLDELRNDFSKDFFGTRQGRPLVNALLYRMLQEGEYDRIPLLYEDFVQGKVRCTPWDDETITYRGETYIVGYTAYLEACRGRRVRRRWRKPSWLSWLHRPRWMRRRG